MNLRIASVKYLNALPFIQALNVLQQQEQLTLIEDTPSQCTHLLKTDQVDIALIPVGSFVDFNHLEIISDYCIGCDGAVRTVKLFSDHPLTELKQIVLDASSRSSNLLVQILCRNHWNLKDIQFVNGLNVQTEQGFIKIGDDVFELEGKYKYEYDLGLEWKLYTGLPFVFAVWAAKDRPSIEVCNMLNESFKNSIAKIPEYLNEMESIKKLKLQDYFEKNISYIFDEQKRSGLGRYLNEIKQIIL